MPRTSGLSLPRCAVTSPTSVRITAVTGGHQHIAHEPPIAGAAQRCPSKTGAEARIIERQQLGQRWHGRGRTRLQFRLAGARGIFVPWTDGKAIIAAKNTVADRSTKFARDLSLCVRSSNRKYSAARQGDRVLERRWWDRYQDILCSCHNGPARASHGQARHR